MKDYKDNSKIKWFTLIELLVSITIFAIIGLIGNNVARDLIDSQRDDEEISEINQLGNILSTIVGRSGEIPGTYCKKWNGTFGSWLTECIANTDYTWECIWKYGDLKNNPSCDKGCIAINCSNGFCSNGNTYYDFQKLITENTKFNLNYSLITKNLSYRICPLSTSWKTTVGKANEWLLRTFNPSFTFFHKWIQVYQYNSNP